MSIMLPIGELVPGSEATSSLFGGNVLATRSTMTGEGSYAEAVDGMGVAGLRYPGGSLTEYCFDLSDPDTALAMDDRTGEVSDFIPLSEFMSFAETNGHAVTIVLPTRTQFGDSYDVNGNRTPEIDEEVLRDFVHDLATGVYGAAQVRALEFGNEYWGSGECNAVEYGQLASRMALIVRDELDLVERLHGIDTSQTKLLIQMGSNHGSSRLSQEYEDCGGEEAIAELIERFPSADISADCLFASGEVNWTEINDALIRMAFDTDESRDAIDGVIAHVYSQGTEFSRQFALDCIRSGWLEQEGFEDLEVHVTEWNVRMGEVPAGEEPGGLAQAQEMLELVEEFMSAGVDQAHVWPLIQNTTNALAPGFEYETPSVAGEMFSMLSQHLPGKSLIDLARNDPDETELTAGAIDVHAFLGDGEMLLYALSKADTPVTTGIDLSALLEEAGAIEIFVLEQGGGLERTTPSARTSLSGDMQADAMQDLMIECELKPGEIMQVLLRDIVPIEVLSSTTGILPSEAAVDAWEAPKAIEDTIETEAASLAADSESLGPSQDTQQESIREETNDPSDDGSWAGLSAALMLLPLLALLGG